MSVACGERIDPVGPAVSESGECETKGVVVPFWESEIIGFSMVQSFLRLFEGWIRVARVLQMQKDTAWVCYPFGRVCLLFFAGLLIMPWVSRPLRGIELGCGTGVAGAVVAGLWTELFDQTLGNDDQIPTSILYLIRMYRDCFCWTPKLKLSSTKSARLRPSLPGS